MKITTLLTVLTVIFALSSVFYAYMLHLLLKKNSNDYGYGKHFCNDCKTGFIHTKEDRERTTCMYCGKPLTLHIQNPDYIPNDTPDKEQQENPFEDFQQ